MRTIKSRLFSTNPSGYNLKMRRAKFALRLMSLFRVAYETERFRWRVGLNLLLPDLDLQFSGKGSASGTTVRPKRVRTANGSDFVEQRLAPLKISHRLRLGNLGRDFGWRSILCFLRAAPPHSPLPVAFTREIPNRRRGTVRPRHFAIQIDSQGAHTTVVASSVFFIARRTLLEDGDGARTPRLIPGYGRVEHPG